MRPVTQSHINGDFEGWDGDNIYELANGQIWKQVHYKYSYHYAYQPKAQILTDGTRYYLQVEGMNEMIEVRRES